MTATSIESSVRHADHDAAHRFEDAERRLLDEYDVEAHSRRLAASLLPDTYVELMRATMAMPGWRLAMSSHLNLAMRMGRPRSENLLTDDELRSIEVPVRLILGDNDVYGGPEIGRRAAALMRDADVHVLPAGHAPFADEPQECAALIRSAS